MLPRLKRTDVSSGTEANTCDASTWLVLESSIAAAVKITTDRQGLTGR
mgnify:CR=1 FL=1